jgi:hypothetical protein
MAFTAFLIGHILAGLTCVVTGVIAMRSQKRRGPHPRFGTVYYWSLAVVFVTATGMALMRWSQDYHLAIIGSVTFGCASVGYAARKIRWNGWITAHIWGMGLSYAALLTGFYVDNGPNLPVWQRLPHLTYWLLPSAIGVPLILRAVARWSARSGIQTAAGRSVAATHNAASRNAPAQRPKGGV